MDGDLPWPRQIWAAEKGEQDPTGWHVFSEHATVARYEGDKEFEREFHRYVDGDIFDSQTRYFQHQLAILRGQGSPIVALLPFALREAERAMKRYPQPNYTISKWAEESGEVTKALIHRAEDRYADADLVVEIIQVLAVLHRLMIEGDQVHGLAPIGPAVQRIAALNAAALQEG